MLRFLLLLTLIHKYVIIYSKFFERFWLVTRDSSGNL